MKFKHNRVNILPAIVSGNDNVNVHCAIIY